LLSGDTFRRNIKVSSGVFIAHVIGILLILAFTVSSILTSYYGQKSRLRYLKTYNNSVEAQLYMSGLMDIFVGCMIFIVFDETDDQPVIIFSDSHASYAVLNIIAEPR
jgi:Na+/alanine symporter